MFAFALRNLFSRPVRTVLALLGLSVAIMGMVGLFSVAAGVQATMDTTFGRVPGLLAMQPGAPFPLFSKLPASWADEVEKFPGVRVVGREVWSRIQLVEGKVTFNPPRFLFGADVENSSRLKINVYRDDIVEGRYLTPEDRGALNCLVSKTIAGEYRKTVGSTLRVDGYDLQIVGIYDTGSLLLDVAILVHGDVARKIAQFDEASVSSFYVEPDGTVPVDELLAKIENHFRGRGPAATMSLGSLSGGGGQGGLADLALNMLAGTAPKPDNGAEKTVDDRGIEIRTAQEFGQRLASFTSELDIFLWLMNLIGVVIALLSILNTMLMSVSERLIEFGVLRANGWTGRDVLKLIVAESAVLGFCGGVIGCVLGILGTFAVNWYFASKIYLYASPPLLVVSLLFAVVLGMIGGAYPAVMAIRMSPIDAIRRG
ncbi:MAG TPA: ABC transporter permease [Planctomycetaceae bacterium]|nr:ABC transporter permease [Planctomycetaceae bacterium]